MKKITVTPIFILLVIFILLAGLTAINGLLIHNRGGASLGGGIAFFLALFAFAALVLEQVIIYFINPAKKVVWIAESLLIVVLIIVLRVSNFEFSIG
jgi:hypothetical protein